MQIVSTQRIDKTQTRCTGENLFQEQILGFGSCDRQHFSKAAVASNQWIYTFCYGLQYMCIPDEVLVESSEGCEPSYDNHVYQVC